MPRYIFTAAAPKRVGEHQNTGVGTDIELPRGVGEAFVSMHWLIDADAAAEEAERKAAHEAEARAMAEAEAEAARVEAERAAAEEAEEARKAKEAAEAENPVAQAQKAPPGGRGSQTAKKPPAAKKTGV